MKTSIATVSISGELPEKLEAIAKAGFAGVEIFENDFLAFDGSPKDVGKMVRDYGLEITLFQPFRDFEGMPEPYRQRVFDRAERKFDVMQDLGTDLVLICSSLSPVSLGGIDRAADDFTELGDRAAKRGLRVGYEALAWGRRATLILNRSSQFLKIRYSSYNWLMRQRLIWICSIGAGISAICRAKAIWT
jgi:4-hydroxyphenylpyruvate dioxygenase